jgi:hypothetical protein
MKTITKKLRNEIFVWDPTTYKGKGYWYILGKKGAYGRPASRKEFAELGRPNEKETIPESPKVFDEPEEKNQGMSYQQASKIRERGLRNLIAGKIISGGNIGDSIKEGISESVKAKLTGLKERLDPLNVARKLTGNVGAALLGKITGRSKEDMEYFTGTKSKKRSASPVSTKINPNSLKKIEDATSTKVSSGRVSDLKNKDSLSDVLAKMYNLIKKSFDDDKKHRQLENNFKKQKEKEKDKWNQELIEAITGMKTKGGKLNSTLKEVKKNKSGKLNPRDMSEEGQQIYKITEGLGEGIASIGSKLGMRTLVTGMTRLFPYAAGIAGIGLTAYGLAKLFESSKDPNAPKNDQAVIDNQTTKMRYGEVKERYQKDKSGLIDETGKSDKDIKEFLDNPQNEKSGVLEYVPKGTRTKNARKIKKIETPEQAREVLHSGIIDNKEEFNKLLKNSNLSEDDFSKMTRQAPSKPVSPVVEPEKISKENKSSESENEVKKVATTINNSMQTASLQPNVNSLSTKMQSVNNEYVDNRVSQTGSTGSAIIADNSKKINIINNNNDGLMVEQLVAVREYESSFEKTIRQNLRMV